MLSSILICEPHEYDMLVFKRFPYLADTFRSGISNFLYTTYIYNILEGQIEAVLLKSNSPTPFNGQHIS